MGYWTKRLDKFRIPYVGPQHRFDESFIYFEDYDGLGLELVENQKDTRPGFTYGKIPPENAIKGFYGITLSEEAYEKTAGLLIGQIDHALIAEKGSRFRYSSNENPWNFVDVLWNPDSLKGLPGYGTVHHVAFATAGEYSQLEACEKLLKFGLDVTSVLNRKYFHSIYFREPGGVLFEIATIHPGFLVDESLEHLGESLQLPAWLESNRVFIEKRLQSVIMRSA